MKEGKTKSNVKTVKKGTKPISPPPAPNKKEVGFKEIKLKISDSAFNAIKSSLMTKKLCDSFYGPLDEALLFIIRNIDDGEDEVIMGLKVEEEALNKKKYERKKWKKKKESK